jgi:fructan beta-fructosidase
VATVTLLAIQSTKENGHKGSEFPRRTAVRVGFRLLLAVTLPWAAPMFSQHATTEPTPAQTTSWRPEIHFYSPSHWINDPNGPILLNGQYHLFFQWNPLGDQWGNTSWGHAVSPDLIHWKQFPAAIPKENDVFIFSGSSVEDRDNTSGLCAALERRPRGA